MLIQHQQMFQHLQGHPTPPPAAHLPVRPAGESPAARGAKLVYFMIVTHYV